MGTAALSHTPRFNAPRRHQKPRQFIQRLLQRLRRQTTLGKANQNGAFDRQVLPETFRPDVITEITWKRDMVVARLRLLSRRAD